MFSVVIPLYNKEQSIQDTIGSVLAQTYPHFEVVVVNDGSTDDSKKKVLEMNDPRIVLVNKQNGGESSARNAGIEKAGYDWVAFLDGDDLWHPDFLSKVHEVIEKHPYIGVVGTGYALKNKKTDTIIKEFLPSEDGEIEDYFKTFNERGDDVFNSSCTCVKKNSLLAVGPFRQDITHGPDLDMWERLGRKNRIWTIDQVLSFYVQDAENRVMHKLPNIYKTHVYNVDTADVSRPEERKYYKNLILNSMLNSFAKFDLRRMGIIYRRHSGFLGLGEVLQFFLLRIKAKFSGKNQ